MAGNLIDANLVIRAWLKESGTDLHSTVGDRVHVMPPGLPRDISTPDCVSVEVVPGGRVQGNIWNEVVHVDVRGWSKWPVNAHKIQQYAHDALHRATWQAGHTVTIDGTEYRVVRARRITPITTQKDQEEGDYWLATATYEVMIINKTRTGEE